MTKLYGVPVQNNSRLSMTELEPLLKFAIFAVGQVAQNTRVTIADEPFSTMMTGLAEMYGEEENALYPSHVQINIGTAMTPNRYPSVQQYLAETPRITVASWEEEFLLVVAHELRHVKQFWTDFDCADQHGMEVDAEGFAIQTLMRWRQRSTLKAA